MALMTIVIGAIGLIGNDLVIRIYVVNITALTLKICLLTTQILVFDINPALLQIIKMEGTN